MTKRKLIPVKRLIAKWREEPAFMREYEAQQEEFALATAMITARSYAGLTQQQLAKKMSTTQAVIARWEGGRVKPSTRTLEKLALATGTRLRITFERSRTQTPRFLSRVA